MRKPSRGLGYNKSPSDLMRAVDKSFGADKQAGTNGRTAQTRRPMAMNILEMGEAGANRQRNIGYGTWRPPGGGVAEGRFRQVAACVNR